MDVLTILAALAMVLIFTVLIINIRHQRETKPFAKLFSYDSKLYRMIQWVLLSVIFYWIAETTTNPDFKTAFKAYANINAAAFIGYHISRSTFKILQEKIENGSANNPWVQVCVVLSRAIIIGACILSANLKIA